MGNRNLNNREEPPTTLPLLGCQFTFSPEHECNLDPQLYNFPLYFVPHLFDPKQKYAFSLSNWRCEHLTSTLARKGRDAKPKRSEGL